MGPGPKSFKRNVSLGQPVRHMATCALRGPLRKWLHVNLKWAVNTLVITVPKWRQPKCPSTCEWINNPWYSHTMGND